MLEAPNLDFLFVLTFMRNGSDKGEVRKGTGRVDEGKGEGGEGYFYQYSEYYSRPFGI